MLNLLTATGNRPHAFALCVRMMLAQTYRGPVHWVIVDDGAQPTPFEIRRAGWTYDLVRPRPFWKDGNNTQQRNLIAGMAALEKNACIAVIEDDDYYSPCYLTSVAHWLQSADLVGEAPARYYNVATRRGKLLDNTKHASLCTTAFRDGGTDAFRRALLQRADFIDVHLWENRRGKLHDERLSVGIKGLPGRRGIGIGHADFFGDPDPDGALLREWLGADAAMYEGFAQ